MRQNKVDCVFYLQQENHAKTRWWARKTAVPRKPLFYSFAYHILLRPAPYTWYEMLSLSCDSLDLMSPDSHFGNAFTMFEGCHQLCHVLASAGSVAMALHPASLDRRRRGYDELSNQRTEVGLTALVMIETDPI